LVCSGVKVLKIPNKQLLIANSKIGLWAKNENIQLQKTQCQNHL
jgi:hypothetical protein